MFLGLGLGLEYPSIIRSHIIRKPAFCIWENKGADELCGNSIVDQRLCFRYTVQIPLISKSKISSPLLLLFGLVLVGTPKTGFLMTALTKYSTYSSYCFLPGEYSDQPFTLSQGI